jgi:tetratricopeptide (TPR) repeat protein
MLLAGITTAAVALRRRAPYLLVGWLWYLITLVPVIGLVQIGRQGHADRYTYVPMLGVYIAAAWGLRDAVRRWPTLRVQAVAGALAALLCFSLLSWRQIGTWRTSRTLYEHAIAMSDDNYFAEQTLGAALRADGDLSDARQHLEAAIRISPVSYYAHEQLGLLYEQQHDHAAAEAAYEHALQLSDHAFYARRHLAAMRRAEGRVDEQIQLLRDELRFEPDDFGLHFDLGTTLLQAQRLPDATVELQRAVALQPSSAEAHNNLGVALAKQGRFAEAIAELERTLALDPEHRTAAKSLAVVRAQSGQP